MFIHTYRINEQQGPTQPQHMNADHTYIHVSEHMGWCMSVSKTETHEYNCPPLCAPIHTHPHTATHIHTYIPTQMHIHTYFLSFLARLPMDPSPKAPSLVLPPLCAPILHRPTRARTRIAPGSSAPYSDLRIGNPCVHVYMYAYMDESMCGCVHVCMSVLTSSSTPRHRFLSEAACAMASAATHFTQIKKERDKTKKMKIKKGGKRRRKKEERK